MHDNKDWAGFEASRSGQAIMKGNGKENNVIANGAQDEEDIDDYHGEDPCDRFFYCMRGGLPQHCCWVRSSMNNGLIAILVLHNFLIGHGIYQVVTTSQHEDLNFYPAYFATLLTMQLLGMLLSAVLVILIILGMVMNDSRTSTARFLRVASKILLLRTAVCLFELLFHNVWYRADYYILGVLSFLAIHAGCALNLQGFYVRTSGSASPVDEKQL